MLYPTVKMMNEMCLALMQMERNGIKIDLVELNSLIEEYSLKHEALKLSLQATAQAAMGDTPINLDSPEQLSRLIYSTTVNDKRQWKEIFGLETKKKGDNSKSFPTYYDARAFRSIMQGGTQRLYKTVVRQCEYCKGRGKIPKLRKDRKTYFKRAPSCRTCSGKGVIYKLTNELAGFNVRPSGSSSVTALGFSTNKDQLEKLARSANGESKQFLTDMVEYNAISTYLNTYLLGIRKNTNEDGILHTQFMQCVARTGRLSSRNPNFQNLPRAGTFPIRKVVISRFEKGKIIKADYSQLEFRVAVELSGDEQGSADIQDGVDVHNNTSTILTGKGQRTNRQDSKPHTFKPLFGGMSGTDAEVEYYKWFLERYAGISTWHSGLLSSALTLSGIRIPSGRIYKFPHAKRFPNGGVSGATQIKNYPVQGFATADIVPIAVIECNAEFGKRELRSKIFLTVHDEIVVDTHPDEIDIVARTVYNGMMDVPRLLMERYGYEFKVPLAVDVSIGDNWMECEDYEIS